MPSLPSAIFIGGDADAYVPVNVCGGIWSLQCPTSPEIITASTTVLINMHFSLTLPTGYSYIVLPYGNDDVNGLPNCIVRSAHWSGTGSARDLFINVMNVGTSDRTPVAGSILAYLYIYKNELKLTL